MKRFKKALFIFHRDLRVTDNSGLNKALEESEEVLPIFIFERAQVEVSNKYRSLLALQFMVESLEDLSNQLAKKKGKLFFFYGSTQEVVERLVKEEGTDAVFSNRDYTPFARKRDATLEKSVVKKGGVWISCDDALLCNPDTLFTAKGTPYTIYTAFLKKAVQKKVLPPAVVRKGSFSSQRMGHATTLSQVKKDFPSFSSLLGEKGGREAAKKILNQLHTFKNYTETRDHPSHPTTGLSAHLKFGTVSVREVVYALKEKKSDQQLVKQLYWRDFFTYLAYHFPRVFGKSFIEKYQKIAWQNNASWFVQWCEGTTGFPLVDAGMRQLNTTGYMHNRVRMVVASFLTKDMHIDWRKGERYFAQHLVDYDPCVNNGNWQWAASTGADAQPYFRIFNPWLQQKKFDPECAYIKQWVPELASLTSKEIHRWYKATSPHQGYPVPLLDHAQESKKALKIFRACGN
jgi:deoxyribodipyrimidine photo-lyase